MPTTLFDLLFLISALAAVVTLVAAAVAAASGRGAKALRMLRALGIAAVLYLAAGLAVSWIRPQRVMALREPWCFDDWCLTVMNAQPATAGSYRVDLVLSSRAKRVTQRAKWAWIYLVDASGRRFPPEPDANAAPLDAALGPGESVTTTRVFRLPPDARPAGIITGHGGPYCGVMNFLVIGDSGCVFGKAPMIKIE
jgi:hypothetical protein